jgi:hypothetical protein
MGDEAAHIELSGEDEAGDFFLQKDVGGVAADKIFFVHADRGEVQSGLLTTSGVGEEENLAAAAEKSLSFADDVVGWDSDDDGVEAATASDAGGESGEVLSRSGGRLFRGWIAEPFCAELAGEFEARIEEVGGNDFDAAQSEQAGEHESDGPLTGDEHNIAAKEFEAIYRFEDGVDRFEHRAFEEGVAVWDFYDARKDEGHDADVSGVTAAGGFEAGSDACAFVLFALGEGVMAASMALKAGDVVMERDAVADFEFSYFGADANDGSGGFVAEDARGRNGAVMDFFDVGRTDATDGDFDEEFARADFGDGQSLNAEVIRAAIDDRLHGFRDGDHVCGLIMAEESGRGTIFDFYRKYPLPLE